MNTTTTQTETKCTCTTCGRPVANPFRCQDSTGKTVAGCIAADHDGQLYGSSAEWHNRPTAKQYRRDHAKWLRSL